MQRIGLIGGLTWISTAEYYRRLNEIIQARLGGANSADLVLASVNREDYDQATSRNDADAARAVLLAAAQRVERAGADFIALLQRRAPVRAASRTGDLHSVPAHRRCDGAQH